MADKIAKLLAKLSKKQLSMIEQIIVQIIAGDVTGLDIKALRGKSGQYRARVGDYRIIYSKNTQNEVRIISIAKRDERTYKNL